MSISYSISFNDYNEDGELDKIVDRHYEGNWLYREVDITNLPGPHSMLEGPFYNSQASH